MRPRSPLLNSTLAALAAVTLVACAAANQGGGGDDEDAEAGAAPGTLAPPSGFMAPPALDASFLSLDGGPRPGNDARAPATAAPAGRCTPNLCLQCDAAGRVIIPDEDQNCPAVDCTVLDTYALAVDEADGAHICQRLVHLQSSRRCDGPGMCHMAADVITCADVRPVEQARTSSACEIMRGCDGADPPMLGPASAGEPCGDAGLCRANGMCDTSIAQSCRVYAGAQICDAGVHVSGEQYCDIAAAGGSCLAACQMYQRPCLAAYLSDAQAPCLQGEPTGCLVEGANLRCRCQNR